MNHAAAAAFLQKGNKMATASFFLLLSLQSALCSLGIRVIFHPFLEEPYTFEVNQITFSLSKGAAPCVHHYILSRTLYLSIF